MVDRCDTEEHVFLFASCGRPFYFARSQFDPEVAEQTSAARHAKPGVGLERRHGNFAAATMDEMFAAWPVENTKIVDPHGRFVFIEPVHQHVEGIG